MSAADVVIAARYQRPRLIFAVNPQADPQVQQAQLAIGQGLAQAETEMRACGFEYVTAQHLARMVALMFLSPHEHSEMPAGALLDALVDRLNREGWLSR